MINVVKDSEFEVWTDTEVAFRDGRCIGLGSTEIEALLDAQAELILELARIDELIKGATK